MEFSTITGEAYINVDRGLRTKQPYGWNKALFITTIRYLGPSHLMSIPDDLMIINPYNAIQNSFLYVSNHVFAKPFDYYNYSIRKGKQTLFP